MRCMEIQEEEEERLRSTTIAWRKDLGEEGEERQKEAKQRVRGMDRHYLCLSFHQHLTCDPKEREAQEAQEVQTSAKNEL